MVRTVIEVGIHVGPALLTQPPVAGLSRCYLPVALESGQPCSADLAGMGRAGSVNKGRAAIREA